MKSFVTLFCILFLFGCAGSKNDLALGTYYGWLPCADCEGIAYALTLDTDSTYNEAVVYQGRSAEVERNNGRYTMDGTGTITLLDKEPTEGMRQFLYKDDTLRMLDLSGKVVRGDLKDRYVLSETKPTGFSMDVQPAETTVDFKATGNEPSWVLTIDFDRQMEFKSLDEAGFQLRTPVPAPVSPQDVDAIQFRAQTDEGELQVTVFSTECTDTMSGEVFSHEVRVRAKTSDLADFVEYTGCGDYVGNYRLNAVWELTELDGEAVASQGKAPNLRFDLHEGQVSGFGGCNRISGPVTMEGNQVRFGNLASTKMACPSMKLEDMFLKALGSGPFESTLSVTTMTLANDRHRMTFERVAP